MHKQIVVVAVIARYFERHVLLGRKAHQALLVYKNAQRLTTQDQHVDAHVEFQTVQQVWSVDVLLNDGNIFEVDFVYFIRQEDTFALTHIVWLHNHWESTRSRFRF